MEALREFNKEVTHKLEKLSEEEWIHFFKKYTTIVHMLSEGVLQAIRILEGIQGRHESFDKVKAHLETLSRLTSSGSVPAAEFAEFEREGNENTICLVQLIEVIVLYCATPHHIFDRLRDVMDPLMRRINQEVQELRPFTLQDMRDLMPYIANMAQV